MALKTSREQIKRTANLILIWVLIGVAFGFFYYLLPGELISSRTGEPVTGILDSIYFSFVTILTIGYGDIYAQGGIRILTAVEGLVGWVLFGIIVYKVVSVKQDMILKEIHDMSNEQYISRIRNFLFISNTNIARFIKEVEMRKISKDSAVYELGIISTTLKSNIDDAARLLHMSRDSVNKEIEESDVLLLVDGVNLCMANFLKALFILPKRERDPVIYENILKIVESAKNIFSYCNAFVSGKKIEEMKSLYNRLEVFAKGY